MRICREAVANVLHHAEASRVEVALQYDGDAILLRVTDDGGGFGRQPARGRRGRPPGSGEHGGSAPNRSGGGVEVTSGAETGTEVRVRLPVH